jgi:group I intron endonuclease
MNLPNHKEFNKKIGIYKITNIINNKCYIGSTGKCLYKRLHQHIRLLKSNFHNNLHLQSAYNLYGKEMFIVDIIEICQDKEEVLSREEFFINYYKSYDPNYGYNIHQFPHTTLGNKWSTEARLKRKGFGKNRKVSDITKKKISEAHMGKKLKESTKEKLRSLPKNNRKVIMLDLNGNFEREFKNIKEAAIFINSITTPICNVINGKAKTCKNHIFILKENYDKNKIEKISKGCTVKVYQYDKNMNFIKEFLSFTEAEKELGIKGANSNISACCKGKVKSAYGYIWKYEKL